MAVKIILKHGKEMPIKRFHPWIFSGAIHRMTGDTIEGAIAEVYDSASNYLATAYLQKGSIAARIISFEKVTVDDEFWFNRIREAYDRRERLGLTGGMLSDACRLVFSEGDGMPGVVIDYYNGVAVIQAHTVGMQILVPVLAGALKRLFGGSLKAVYDKSAESMERSQLALARSEGGNAGEDGGTGNKNGFVYGESGPVRITEAGHRFEVDFIRGQKTGFFLDQRGNRLFAQFYGAKRKVLNACCYSGAFSVYALKGGASHVDSLDSSKQALAWTDVNVELNRPFSGTHRTILADVKQFLAEEGEKYDMIILDPPAFAKTHQVSHNALRAYIHINGAAMKRLNPGGLLMTFSCSQPVSREMFRSAVQSAAIESSRRVRIIHQLTQGPDHPFDACHPEGEYLKGFIASVE